jgi:uncharacterized protein (UPF0262 family)
LPAPGTTRRPAGRIVAITLDERLVVRLGELVAAERAVAIRDLLADNAFRLVPGPAGPYALHLAVADNRLVLQVQPRRSKRQVDVALLLQPFRRLVKDYFAICESYYAAIRRASLGQIEAIDMGRRAVHDEGAAMLRERLAERIAMDNGTARRLFTLLCILHIRA